jgi:DNA-binding NtrC family response regulator
MEPNSILIIDDESSICNACRIILSEKGYVVDTCMNGKEGLEAILTGKYDVILLDLKLPDMGGMEILKVARQKTPEACIIVMTGHSTIKSAVEAMKLGAFDYITKPFSDDELIIAVQRAIEKKRLVDENIILRKELFDRFSYNNIVGEDPKIMQLFDNIDKVAPTNTTVLITGESGTGKELFARAIHAHSKRTARQFIALDCSTLSPTILESELFGHVKGAFTGATQDKKGIFEMADGGTLFLDEIANLNLETQSKLLRVLDLQEYKSVGSSQISKTDARIIAATNQDLKIKVEKGIFREDLFYRLNVFPIFLPPLRERKNDIPKLVYYFLEHFCRKMGKRIEGFTNEAMELLINQEYPGNIRQLKNIVERLVIMADSNMLDLIYLSDHLKIKRNSEQDLVPKSLEELKAFKKYLLEERFSRTEKAFLMKALDECNGSITKAAEKVGMLRPNFSALMKKYNISPKTQEKSENNE